MAVTKEKKWIVTVEIILITICVLLILSISILIRDSLNFKDDFCSKDCRIFTKECIINCDCVEWDTPIMDRVDAIRGGMNRHCNMTPVLENYYEALAHTVEIHEVKVCTKALPRLE